MPQLGSTANGNLVNNLEIISEHGLSDACRFILAFTLDGYFLNYLEALIANLVHARQLAACPDIRASGHRAWEADPVETVIHRQLQIRVGGLAWIYNTRQVGNQRQGQEAVGDCAAEGRFLGRTVNIHMNPLVV